MASTWRAARGTGTRQGPRRLPSWPRPQLPAAAPGRSSRHCPRAWWLVLALAEPWPQPPPPRDCTDSPLSVSRESWGPGPSGLVSGRWPGSAARIECRPGGWMVQERIRCQQSGSPGSHQPGQLGPEKAPGSQSHKRNTCSLVAAGTDEVLGSVAPFLQLGKPRRSARSDGESAAVRELQLQAKEPASLIQFASTELLLSTRFCLGWGDTKE